MVEEKGEVEKEEEEEEGRSGEGECPGFIGGSSCTPPRLYKR